MGYTAREILDVASSQVGYKEKKSNKQLDDFTANAGSGNWTKYARDLYYEANPHYFNGNKNGFAWCCVFVCWCHWIASGKDKSEADRVQCQSGKYGAACNYAASYYKKQGRLDKSPKIGDQIFFGSGSTYKHTGIVEDIDDTYVYTIEGNASNMVKRNKYKLTSSSILAYGHPFFDDSEEVKIEESVPVETITQVEEIEKPTTEIAVIPVTELPTLKKGSKASAAMNSLVFLLNGKTGSSLVKNGSFGDNTLKAVKKWQETHGLKVDGVVGPDTWASIITQ